MSDEPVLWRLRYRISLRDVEALSSKLALDLPQSCSDCSMLGARAVLRVRVLRRPSFRWVYCIGKTSIAEPRARRKESTDTFLSRCFGLHYMMQVETLVRKPIVFSFKDLLERWTVAFQSGSSQRSLVSRATTDGLASLSTYGRPAFLAGSDTVKRLKLYV